MMDLIAMHDAPVGPFAVRVTETPLVDATLRAALEAHHIESFGWAMSCCRRRRDEAENVLQIVYLKVLSGKAVFDGRSEFRTWLFSVIRRTAANERRLAFLRRLYLSRIPPPQRREEVEVEPRLQQELAALSARQREVLQLVFYHGLSIAESARVMGVSIGSARTHYERGKQQLRRRLQ